MVCRAAPHFGEEPCISGLRGSGAVFFAGCNLRCVFCQNHAISRGEAGETVSPARLREIHGASTVYCWPEENGESLFRMPAERKPEDRLQAVRFGSVERAGNRALATVYFRVTEKMRVMYQLVPSLNGKWDFEHTVTQPDKKKTGLIRGLIPPGEWKRDLNLPVSFFGADKRVLLQIITLHGDAQIPAAEAGWVITLD